MSHRPELGPPPTHEAAEVTIEVCALAPEQARAVALVAIQEACQAVTEVCAQLARRGCLVLSAHAVPGRPRVVVMQPPTVADLRGVLRRWDRHTALFAAPLDGVQVEWRVPRSSIGGAAR